MSAVIEKSGCLAIPGDLAARHSMYVSWYPHVGEIIVRVYEHGSCRLTIKGKLTETRPWCDEFDGPQLTVGGTTTLITQEEFEGLTRLLIDIGDPT